MHCIIIVKFGSIKFLNSLFLFAPVSLVVYRQLRVVLSLVVIELRYTFHVFVYSELALVIDAEVACRQQSGVAHHAAFIKFHGSVLCWNSSIVAQI